MSLLEEDMEVFSVASAVLRPMKGMELVGCVCFSLVPFLSTCGMLLLFPQRFMLLNGSFIIA